jgi:hypothetical protein
MTLRFAAATYDWTFFVTSRRPLTKTRARPPVLFRGFSRNRVGESEDPTGLPAAVGAGPRVVAGSRESGILRECLQGDVGFSSITRTASRDFGRTPRCRESSVTALRESWFFIDAQRTACPCGRQYRSSYDRKRKRVRDLSCGGFRVFLDIEIWRVECVSCGTVRQESLSLLADNRSYTKRFVFYVGRRCRAWTIKNIAQERHLDWHTVKDLEKQYMREQLQRAGTPAPKVIGVDEISIKKRHICRIVVSDLVRKRPNKRGSLRSLAQGRHGRRVEGAGCEQRGPREIPQRPVERGRGDRAMAER